jgi:Concanavalin A-like lectin/glucanases superfamily
VDGKAIRLGPGRVVRVNSSRALDLDIFTIDTRVRLDRLPSPGGRMGLVDSDLRYGIFVQPGGGILCSAPGVVISAPAVVQAGIWHQITFVRSTTTMAILVDGREVASQAIVALPGITVTKELVIGGNEPSGDEMEGVVDNLRIWRTVRTPAR